MVTPWEHTVRERSAAIRNVPTPGKSTAQSRHVAREDMRLVLGRRLCSSAASIKATLSLPRTDFPLHAKPASTEPRLAPRLAHEHFARQQELRRDAPSFVLHDGPPYANGELHLGHFLNKSLKDMINRWMLLRGRRIQFTPGWDCHGLPIELRALQMAGAETAHELPPLQVRSQAAACARDAIDAQRASFVRWGVMADWERPYTTMQPEYESAQLGVLQSMLARELIFRGARPVHWSPATRTALAEAELEYNDEHVSPAAYVAFPLKSVDSSTLSASLEEASLVVWTTTPWTLTANQAVCAHPDLTYALVEGAPNQIRLLVAEARIEALSVALSCSLEVVARIPGSSLAGLSAAHPLSGRAVPLLFGTHVTDTAGTGLVHTAPAHGPDDFAVGQAHSLDCACPVDEHGRFTDATEESVPFEGLEVLGSGNTAVLDALASRDALLSVSDYTHRYPYDWRSKTPVIFRTTPQWFVDLSRLREPAIASLEGVEILPAAGRSRLEAFVRSRSEWCLSRQRAWGVPLPAFYHVETGEALLSEETVAHVRSLVAERGSDCWWQLSERELLPPRMAGEAESWRKGTDTLDVWFDSGASWSAVLSPREQESSEAASAAQAPLADLYLEGSDQHRGWFQSSLLTHVGAMPTGKAPYGAIVTHGFVVDERGAKMSKSVGNVISPAELIEGTPAAADAPKDQQTNAAPAKGKSKKQRREERDSRAKQGPIGVDVLRLWVAMSDWTSDVAVGETVLQKSREAYRRLRNSCRFMLGNLHDFDATRDAVPRDAMRMGDRYMLHQLAEYGRAIERSHDAHAVSRVVAASITLASESLSADYFDATKDRLYCGAQDGESRRAVQTVLHETLDTLLLAVGPLVPFLVEEVHEHRREPRPLPPIERTWSPPPAEWLDLELARHWGLAKGLRQEVAKLVHAAQQGKAIKGAGEAIIEIEVDGGSEMHAALEYLGDELNDLLGVCASRVCVRSANQERVDSSADPPLGSFEGVIVASGAVDAASVGAPPLTNLVLRATTTPKCERCWRHVPACAQAETDGLLYRGCACYI